MRKRKGAVFVTYRESSTLIMWLTLTLLGAAGPVFGDAVHTRERTVTQVAPGVYMIRHKDAPSGFPNGNTTVIIGDREVLVVDSCYLASEARQDIAQIRQWTDKPVRYLVNTHVHNDHTMGNGTYADAFPSLFIIAHPETKIMAEGYLSGWFATSTKEIADLGQELEIGNGDDGKPLTEAQRTEVRKNLADEEAVVAEFPNFVPRLPNLTVEHELDLDLGNRALQIKYLGHGNTAGDLVVFLPKEKILITGDIVVHPVPYLCSGYPAEWIDTLQRLIELGPQIVVPGHGEVLHDTSYLVQVKMLLTTVVSAVRNVFYARKQGLELDEVRKNVEKTIDFEALRRQFDGGDQDNFSQSSVITRCLVRNAFYEEVLR
jgi:glyoxylase-like metal-dependent hydrolase (beta-lactamase superfamily II)